jgi:arsenate reductase
LRDNGVEPEKIEYLKTGITADEIWTLLKKLKMKPVQLLRAKDVKAAGLDPTSMSDEQIVAAMVENPKLMERPIVVNGKHAALGRPPENVLTVL